MKFHYLGFDIRLHGFGGDTQKGHTAVARMQTPGSSDVLTVMGMGATKVAARESALEAAMAFLADRAEGELGGALQPGLWMTTRLAS